jgi:hypothetical protein
MKPRAAQRERFVPSKLAELLEHVGRETARMSYPGSMSRGKKPVVHKGTKAKLEEYFAKTKSFPLRQVWLSASRLTATYENWHRARTAEIANALGQKVSKHNNRKAVAAKFLNTFMHQLMKYEPCRPLWPALHLPLDGRVFAALTQLKSPSLSAVQPLLSRSAYSLSYTEYLEVQRALWNLMRELNARRRAEFKLRSRIELNCLWI